MPQPQFSLFRSNGTPIDAKLLHFNQKQKSISADVDHFEIETPDEEPFLLQATVYALEDLKQEIEASPSQEAVLKIKKRVDEILPDQKPSARVKVQYRPAA